MHQMLLTQKDVSLMLEKPERKAVQHDDHIKIIFEYLKELLNPKTEPLRKIGFRHDRKIEMPQSALSET